MTYKECYTRPPKHKTQNSAKHKTPKHKTQNGVKHGDGDLRTLSVDQFCVYNYNNNKFIAYVQIVVQYGRLLTQFSHLK